MVFTMKRLTMVLGLVLLFVAMPAFADGWNGCAICTSEGGSYGNHPRCYVDFTVRTQGWCHTYYAPCSPPYQGVCSWCEDGLMINDDMLTPDCYWQTHGAPTKPSQVLAALKMLAGIPTDRRLALEDVIDHEVARGADSLEASQAIYEQELALVSLARQTLVQMRRGVPVIRRGMIVFAATDATGWPR